MKIYVFLILFARTSGLRKSSSLGNLCDIEREYSCARSYSRKDCDAGNICRCKTAYDDLTSPNTSFTQNHGVYRRGEVCLTRTCASEILQDLQIHQNAIFKEAYYCYWSSHPCDKCAKSPTMKCINNKCTCEKPYHATVQKDNTTICLEPTVKEPKEELCKRCDQNAVCSNGQCKCNDGFQSFSRIEGQVCKRTCNHCINGTCDGTVCKCRPGLIYADRDHPEYGPLIRINSNLKNSVCVEKPRCPCIKGCKCLGHGWNQQPQCLPGYTDITSTMATGRNVYQPGTYCNRCVCNQPERMECVADNRCLCKLGYLDAANVTHVIGVQDEVNGIEGIKCVPQCVKAKTPYFITFILDESSYLSAKQWNDLMTFMSKAHAWFNPESATVQFVKFSSDARYYGELTRGSWNSTTWKAHIKNHLFRHSGGYTNTAAGLKLALLYAPQENRVKRRFILMTNRKPNGEDGHSTMKASMETNKLLREINRKGIKTLNVGIGEMYKEELQSMKFVYSVKDYDDLPKYFTVVTNTVCDTNE